MARKDDVLKVPRALILTALVFAAAACTSQTAPPAGGARATTVITAGPTTSAPVESATSSSPTLSSSPSSVTSSAPSTSADPPPPTLAKLDPRQEQLTAGGMWWGIDSVAPMNADTLANARGWYRGSPAPLVWGRYLTGSFRLKPGELSFARAHGIGVYFIVPDQNCSACSGGDYCGNDRTGAQAITDAKTAIRAARAYHLPAKVVLYKDIEEVGSCHGELTADYLRSWFDYVRRTSYVPAFYGNSTNQSFDFPRAYCQAAGMDKTFAREVTLAQDEPEPQIGPAQGAVGPSNAPRFAPFKPHCVALSRVRLWQYKESGYSADYTDADEIRPGTHGFLAPDGRVT